MNKVLNGFKDLGKVNIKDLAKTFAITIAVGLLYYIVTMATPELSFTLMTGNMGVRIANALTALALINPVFAMGKMMASYAISLNTGKILLGLYSITPFIYYLLSVGMYKVVKKHNTHTVALLCLTAFATIQTVFVALNHTVIEYSIAEFTSVFGTLLHFDFLTLFTMNFALKLSGHLLATVGLGYPLYLAFRRFAKK